MSVNIRQIALKAGVSTASVSRTLNDPDTPKVSSGHCHLNHLDIPDVVRKCGKFFLETHFHDNFGDKDRHCPVGIGTINWIDVISAMKESGYKGEITFEQGNYATNCRNWMLFAEQSLKR